MTESLIHGTITQEWKLIPVDEVIVRDRQREVAADHVKLVRSSFQSLGGQLQLQPIVVDGSLVLIDGAHRLAAAKAEGWEFISAVVCHGATSADRDLLELEANRVRLELTPLELARAWKEFYEPAFKARAKQRQTNGVTAMHHARGIEAAAAPAESGEPESIVIGNTNNNLSEAPVSLAQAARETTGRGLDWLNKIEDIRTIAHAESAPEPLRAAAQRGLQKLTKPGAKVDPIHRELLATQEALSRSAEVPSERQARQLERTLDRALTDMSLLAEKLAGALGDDLVAAAKAVPAGRESLRSVRVSAAHVLAAMIAHECKLEDDPAAALQRVGGESMQLLSELAMKHLGLEVDRG